MVKLAQGQAEIESRGREMARLKYELERVKGGWSGWEARKKQDGREMNDHISGSSSPYATNISSAPAASHRGYTAQPLSVSEIESTASIDDSCEIGGSENPVSTLQTESFSFKNTAIPAPSADHGSPALLNKTSDLSPVFPDISSATFSTISFVFEQQGEFGLTLDETDLTIVQSVRGQAVRVKRTTYASFYLFFHSGHFRRTSWRCNRMYWRKRSQKR